MSLTIKNLTTCPDVIAILTQWHHQQWHALNPACSLQDRQTKLEEHLHTQTLPQTFVAFVNETVVGSASIVLHDMDTRPDLTPWLASVYIDKPFRHQGIAKALIAQIEQYALQQHIKRLYLFTFPDIEAFYWQQAWQTLEKTTYKNQNIVVMYKYIS